MKISVITSALYTMKESQTYATALQAVPAATRRRLSSYAKTLLSAVFDIIERVPAAAQVPVVLASQHGDLRRTIDLLQELVQGEPLSPTQFCLSVNNAVLGQLSMLTSNGSAMTTVGAGPDSFAYAWLEGITQLADAPKVLIIYADEQPPEPYTAYCDSPEAGIAFAALLSREMSQEVSQEHYPDARQLRFEYTQCSAQPALANVIQTAECLHHAIQHGSGAVHMENAKHRWSWHVTS